MDRLGVIDIGSNTVRLVVYDVNNHLPIPMFNEKVTCRLGQGIAQSGKLNPEGAELALINIERFVTLANAMEVKNLSLIATAAVRNAKDGPAFVSEIYKRCRVDVEVLNAEQEAQLSSTGVLYSTPGIDGIIGDLGGGSLELVQILAGKFEQYDSMPLGHLTLRESSGNDLNKARDIILTNLNEAPWIKKMHGKKLYVVGGSMRVLAKVFMRQSKYPLRILDNFSMVTRDVIEVAELLARSSAGSLQNIPDVSDDRIETLPMAALVMTGILEVMQPSDVVFSGLGMREGKMVSLMPDHERVDDPMIAACEVMGGEITRFSLSGRELFDWVSPVFDKDNGQHDRCRLAAALLSDIGWNEHPDFRAEHSYLRTLRLPVAGIDHPERIFLALAIYTRYGGEVGDKITKKMSKLIDEDALKGAIVTGHALRLGHVLAGSAPGLLKEARLEKHPDYIALRSIDNGPLVSGAIVEKRVKKLAKSMNLGFKVLR